MPMKKYLYNIAMVVIVATIAISLTSCEKDSENYGSKEENNYPSEENDNVSYPNRLDVSCNGITFSLIKVKCGTFLMGSDNGPHNSNMVNIQEPVHQVTLTHDYYVGETQVTQELWQAIEGTNPSEYPGEHHPVETVSWNNCQDFISKLNKLTGIEFRLLTEAEWEFAARGGNLSKGYIYSGSNNYNEVVAQGSTTKDVATKKPNELGLYDMSGNVAEWCQDWYDQYNSTPQIDPKGPVSSSYGRVTRNGSFQDPWQIKTVFYRNYGSPNLKSRLVGFRLAVTIPNSSEEKDNEEIISSNVDSYESVDLGLSVKWATCNVGAEKPEDFGDYFAWGETAPKSDYSWSTYKFTTDGGSTFTKYTGSDKTVLDAADDAATANWGDAWRMPTLEEMQDLLDNCTWEWQAAGNTEFGGVAGMKVTSKKDGYTDKYIFLPAAGCRDGSSLYDAGSDGYYWSASLNAGKAWSAYSRSFNSLRLELSNFQRYLGLAVRPVCP